MHSSVLQFVVCFSWVRRWEPEKFRQSRRSTSKICLVLLTVSVVVMSRCLVIKASQVVEFSVGNAKSCASLLITLGRHFSHFETLSSHEVR